MNRDRLRRAWRIGLVMTLVAFAYWRLAPRPMAWPLVTSIDGPDPARASGVIVFLHGRNGSILRAKQTARALREAGLPGDVSIVLLEGPYPAHFGFGHTWGDDGETQAKSRARIRERLRVLLGSTGPPPERVVIAGFSQGAGVAADVATEEPRVGAMASLSPCSMFLRGDLPKRRELRVLLAHGSHDDVCPVNESRSLAKVLDDAGMNSKYVEFDGPHTIPTEVVQALATFATPR